MPIDGHAHLVAQGWSGKGSGLRPGAISRPIVVAQKKTLSGIGKDRDDAFPFWDHVFNAAANSIKVKVYDSDSEDTESSTPTLSLQKTKTGIISNRRPTAGTPALSGTVTSSGEASSSSSGTSTPRLSVMAMAKQQAAKRMLYSMFFRGPVLGNALEDAIVAETAVIEGLSLQEDRQPGPNLSQPAGAAEKETKIKKTKRKRDGELDAQESGRKRSRKGKEKADSREGVSVDDGELSKDAEDAGKAERGRRKAEKRARKEEKRRLKAEKELKALAMDAADDVTTSTASHDPEQNLPGAPTKKEKRRSNDPETKRKKDRAKNRSKSSSSS